MPAADRLLPDLGPDFDQRWRRASRALRRELIAEIRSIYMMLDEDDMPVLAGTPSRPTQEGKPVLQATAVTAKGTRTPAPEQASLFGSTDTAATATASATNSDNPFLPQSVRERLQHSQAQTRTQLQGLMSAKPAQPVSHEQVDLERELRLRLGPVIETLIDAQMDVLKGELRVRLRAEMDKLIAEHLRK